MATTSSLSLCRQLLRTANGFTNYNFREYALRIIREDFKSKRALSGVEAVEARAEGFKQLQVSAAQRHRRERPSTQTRRPPEARPRMCHTCAQHAAQRTLQTRWMRVMRIAFGFVCSQALERQVTVSKLFPQEKHAMESAVKS